MCVTFKRKEIALRIVKKIGHIHKKKYLIGYSGVLNEVVKWNQYGHIYFFIFIFFLFLFLFESEQKYFQRLYH